MGGWLTAGPGRSTGGETPIAHRAVGMLVLQLAGLVVSFGVQILLTRSLGVNEYGTYIYALRWLGLLTLLAQGGLAIGALRFVPQYTANERWSELAGFLGAGRRGIAVAAVVVGGLTWLAVTLIGEAVSRELRATLGVALLGLPVLGLFQFATATLRGSGQVVRSQLAGQFIRPLAFGVGVALLVSIVDTAPQASWVMALNMTAVAAAGLLVIGWLRTALPWPARHSAPLYDLRTWSQVMPPLLLHNLLGMLIQRLDVLMVGALLGVRQVALYAVASRAAGLLVFCRKAVNTWAAPEISRLYACGDQQALVQFVRRSSRAVAALSLPMTALLLVGSPTILGLFGVEYGEARTLLIILVLGHFLSSFFGPSSFLLTMTGGERTVVVISAAALALGAVLYGALIPTWGVTGAAIAAAAIRVAYNAGVTAAAWKKRSIRATAI